MNCKIGGKDGIYKAGYIKQAEVTTDMLGRLKGLFFRKQDVPRERKAEENAGGELGEKTEREKQKRVESLTPREYEAYLILLEGYTLRYCAEQMGVKYPTANTFANAIYKKLGIKSKARLILDYRNIKQK